MKKIHKKEVKKTNRRITWLTSISIGLFVLFLLTIASFVPPIADWLLYPNLGRASRFEYLNDWNNAKHVNEDVDGAGQQDFVSFVGCAILSSHNEESILDSEQCILPMEYSILPANLIGRTVGVKSAQEPGHAYMLQQDGNSPWNIVVY